MLQSHADLWDRVPAMDLRNSPSLNPLREQIPLRELSELSRRSEASRRSGSFTPGSYGSAIFSRSQEDADRSPPATEPVADRSGSRGSATGEQHELQLVRALGEIILRVQDMQVERILEQGRRIEETLKKQQCSLAALEEKVTFEPVSPSTVEQPPVDDTQGRQNPFHSDIDMQQTKPLSHSGPRMSDWNGNQLSSSNGDLSMGDEPQLGTEDASDVLKEVTGSVGLPYAVAEVVLGQKDKYESADVPNRCGASFVMSNAFGLLSGFLISLNGVLILMQTDDSAQDPGGKTKEFYVVAETCFFFIFAAELALRLWVFRCDFFIGEDWRWNCFDALIVFAAACEELVKFIELGSSVAKKATFLRAMRLFKFGRITRVFRVVTLFRDLRIMVASIIATMMTLFWSIVCLVMIMIAFATFFLTVVADHQAANGRNHELDQYFGSMVAMILSLFQITTGGFDWRDMSNLLMEVSPSSVVVLCMYVSMMEYAVLNILTGICCNTANKTAEDDFDIAILEQQSRQASVTKKLTKYLNDHDLSGNGVITWEQLDCHLSQPQVRGYFKKLDLEFWHLQTFFNLLDTKQDGNPSIGIDDFLRICTRLRCSVKNIDLIAASHERQDCTKKQFLELKEKIDSIQRFISCMTETV